MRAVGEQVVYSPTDLASFFGCEHLVTLELRHMRGELTRPYFPDPGMKVLEERGNQHERNYLETLRGEGKSVREIAMSADARAETLAVLREGVDVVYQAALSDGAWAGRSDFLVRIARPSNLGAWSYEIIDTKLARTTKARAIVQLCIYAELLAAVQGHDSERFGVVLGTNELEWHLLADYLAYVRSVKARFLDAVAHENLGSYPEPVDHCDVCDWYPRCEQQWRSDDHLSLVAGITRRQRRALAEQSVSTVVALGSAAEAKLRTVDSGIEALTRVKEQARIQVEGRAASRVLHELLAIEAEAGLASLPEPSPGDLFFDIEGDPYVADGGLEYLFGYAEPGESPPYRGLWAHDHVNERRIFEEFIDIVLLRLEKWPAAHVYHYAPYEPTAMKRLMCRYGTREDEVDRLLRAGVFVDLYRVVKQSIRASVESYSIKKLEPLYGYNRTVELRSANQSLVAYETWIELGQSETAPRQVLDSIEGYNRDDCLSTYFLRQWLESLRPAALPRPAPRDGAPREEVQAANERTAEVFQKLQPVSPLLANLLEWHRREDKSAHWEYFHLCEIRDSLIEERRPIGGLEYVGIARTEKKSHVHEYKYPPQDHDLAAFDKAHDPETRAAPGTLVLVDDAKGILHLKRGVKNPAPHPLALIPYDIVGTNELRESLLALGDTIASQGLDPGGPYQAACNLLQRRPPRIVGTDVIAIARSLDHDVLAVQGPPGAGKTTLGADLIATLIAEGKRIGIVATSHKVIGKLLGDACKVARKRGKPIVAMQKATDEQGITDESVEVVQDNEAMEDACREGTATLFAGTQWLWAREGMIDSVDFLIVDEAGQMSLANVLAIARAGKSLILLGDPQQLDQPQKGMHPPGAEVSALEHLLDGLQTITQDRGVLLPTTWRLHPAICKFTSQVFYEGKLHADPRCERQVVSGTARLSGAGLRFVPVTHTGNTNESIEEARAIRELIDELLAQSPMFTDCEGKQHELEPENILVVTPYNAQLRTLREHLPPRVQIGTVDKFQGQEAPIAIYSMATSTPEDAPRGMEFLYSLNRLNVATSRARAVSVVVASPTLLRPTCRTPHQMKLANALCSFVAMADEIKVAP